MTPTTSGAITECAVSGGVGYRWYRPGDGTKKDPMIASSGMAGVALFGFSETARLGSAF